MRRRGHQLPGVVTPEEVQPRGCLDLHLQAVVRHRVAFGHLAPPLLRTELGGRRPVGRFGGGKV